MANASTSSGGSSGSPTVLENRDVKLEAAVENLFIKAARIEEALSTLTEMTVEFFTADRDLDVGKLIGQPMTVKVQIGENSWRDFKGTCIEVEYLGFYQGFSLFTAQLRPWLWFLTQTSDNRIYQEQKVDEIIKKIFGDNGFSDHKFTLGGTYDMRPYSVQYRETDFDFLSRLMEEEGLYYFSSVDGGVDKLFVVDGVSGHSDVEGAAKVAFHKAEEDYRRADDHVFEWQSAERTQTGKVTLTDYDFETPRADLKTSNALAKGTHSHKNYEVYRHPGNYRDTGTGQKFARVEMEQLAARHQVRRGVCNVPTFGVGRTFTLEGHDRKAENAPYLITRATHHIQIESESDDKDSVERSLSGRLEILPGNKDRYRCVFEAIPKATPFRAERKTPWPRIPGILLAKVVGPSGEEIHTDKYGRIKIQFPWDRDGKNDDKSTCFVRTVMPWTGKGWGFVAVPRVGQEVTIQFEDGNPDRPICTGMLYNSDTMPPYGLPENMTQSGVKTNSSKGGGGFNELMMEDKKGSELVRFQAEKDFSQIVKNNATITIGIEKADAGDLTQTIQNNRTETVKAGNSTFTVETGSEARTINANATEDIGQNHTQTIGGNSSVTIGGNLTEDVGGSQASTVGSSMSLDVGTSLSETIGSSQSTTAGTSISISANTSIELKVGANSIKIDQSGVTIAGLMVSIDGKTMTTVSSKALVIIDGKITMIN